MPTAHYAMGGIPTNVNAEVLRDNDTVVPGLYAAGECACVSVHGSNRLGTNSLLDINVFGKRAGNNAVEYASTAELRAAAEGPGEGRARPRRAAARLDRHRADRGAPQGAAGRRWTRSAQVFRTDESLAKVTEIIHELRERYKNIGIQDKGRRFNTDLLEAIELGFLLDLAEVVVYSARNRKESRGGHMRDDFPKRDDANYMQHTMAYLTGDPHSADAADHITLDWKPVVDHAATSRWSGSTDVVTPHRRSTTGINPAIKRRSRRGLHDVTLIIRRFDPEVDAEPHWQDFDVEMLPTDRVLDALHKIKWEQDGSLTFRRSLRPRRLRLGRDAHQRPQPARLQDADQGPRHRRSRSTSRRSRACRSRRTSSSTWSRSSRPSAQVQPFLHRRRRKPEGKERLQSRRAARALRRHDQVHPLRGVHLVVPGVLDRRPVLRPGRDRERAPLHLRLAATRAPRCASTS